MENNIVKLAQYGDKNAFDTLVETYKKELYAIAKSRLKIEADVEDAVQETLFSVYKDIWSLKNENHFKTWIVRILINNCNDIISENNGMILYFDDTAIERVEDDTDEYLKMEGDQDFFDMIDFLSNEEKAIMIMRYSQDFNINDISNVLNIKEGTIRMKILRIKEKIKDRYEDKGRMSI